MLAEAGAVQAVRLAADRWLVSPTSKVGVVRSGDVEMWIAPKIGVRRLLFLLGYARNPSGWQDVDVPMERDVDLLPAIAHALARQADRALQQGVLQGYRQVDDALPVVRGRLRETDQLRRRFGIPVPLEVRFDEFTVDIAENRIVRAAVERALKLPRLSAHVRRTLHRLLVLQLDGVSALDKGRPLPTWRPSRLNIRYHAALRLAEVLLMAQSFEQRRGDLLVSGFLFNLASVFEDFVCVALREALAPHGGRAHLQFRTFLDQAAQIRMRPDLVWLRDGRPVSVVDAKYKAEKPAGFPDADLYQILAYCTALDLPVGHLVYAKGNATAARHAVRHVDVRIVCHALDLEQSPDGVLAGIGGIAADIRATAGPRRRNRSAAHADHETKENA